MGRIHPDLGLKPIVDGKVESAKSWVPKSLTLILADGAKDP
jgi:hypothetical protein